MAARKRTKQKITPLIVEPHPKDYNGYPFITLIQYHCHGVDQHILTVVDNADEKTIKAFVLDFCGPEAIDEEMIITIANEWYTNNRDRYPISFEFSKLGVSNQTAKIFRTFNINFVSRVIGPMAKFPMGEVKSVKRRRRKPVPVGIEVYKKLLKID